MKITLYLKNNKVSKFLSWKPYKDIIKIKNYFKYATNSINFPDEILSINYNGTSIGTAHILSKGGGVTQIGFGILPNFWNKGLGSIILKKLILYIKKSEWSNNTKEIIGVIHKNNIYAIKIFQKENFAKVNKIIKKDYIYYSKHIK